MSNKKNKRTEQDEDMNKLASEMKPLDLHHFPRIHNPTNPQTDIPAESMDHTPTTQQKDNIVSPQIGKTTKPVLYKYTTHLRADTIKAIKRLAVEDERKDYEVVQEALDAFFRAKEDFAK